VVEMPLVDFYEKSVMETVVLNLLMIISYKKYGDKDNERF